MKSITKTLLAATTLVAASLSVQSAEAGYNGKNYGGALCKKVSSGTGAAYYDTSGRVCNNSSTKPLEVICPVTMDEIKNKKFITTVDYIMWNLNGLNGNENSHPDESLKCNSFSKTRHGYGYYWSQWKEAADTGNGYGSHPSGLSMTTNAKDTRGFIGVHCQIPETYSNKRSCISHICVDEQD